MAEEADTELYALLEKMIDKKTIDEMKTQKINCSRIAIMDEASLERYIPLYGDRIELLDFAKRKLQIQTMQTRKEGIVARLMQKYQQRKKGELYLATEKRKYTLKKNTRKVEMGWLHKNYDFEEYKQVRQSNGGGTRQVEVSKTATKEDLLELGKNIFFPSGFSKQGSVTDFIFDLLDFQRDSFNNLYSVEEIFNKTQLSRVKFYLATKKKFCSSTSTSVEIYTDGETSNTQFCLPQALSNANESLICNPTDILNLRENESGPICKQDLPDTCQSSNHLTTDCQTVNTSMTLQHANLELTCRDKYESNYNLDGEYDFEEISSASQLPSIPGDAETTTVYVNREDCVSEMLALYSQDEILNKKLMVEFLGETGVDSGGLTKELFALFWKRVEPHYFIGENGIVPFLPLHKKKMSDDFIKMGRIFSHMVLLTNAVPVKFSRIFLLTLGGSDIEDNILIEDFLLYLTEIERNVIRKSLDSFLELTDSDTDLLLNIFQCFNFYENPKKNEIREQIKMIARDVLIEKPQCFVKKFTQGMPHYIQQFFNKCSVQTITFLLGSRRPTTTKFLECLAFTGELNNDQTRVLHYLRLFVGSLNGDGLLQLLFFITGSYNLPIDTKLNISFNGLKGDLRRPISHTCSNTLELSSFFHSYQEFKSNMDIYLSSAYSYQYNQI